MATTNGQSDAPNRLFVSVDTIHKSGSTTEERGGADRALNPLQAYVFEEGKLIQDASFQIASAVQNEDWTSGDGASGRLTNLLYSLENLRKREGDAQED